jgi:hypothetical protein
MSGFELVAGLVHELEQFAAWAAGRESPVDVVLPPGSLPAFLQVDRFRSLVAAETGGKSIGKCYSACWHIPSDMHS